MSDHPTKKVDIIILNYNGKEDTVECLKSLRQIDYPEYRITVVDNGSSDGSAETVKGLFPEVNLIISPQNLRFAGGNNLALRQSLEDDFDYMLLLNNDTVVEADFLSWLVESGEADEEVGLIGPKMYYYHHPQILWFAGSKVNLKFAYMRHLGIGKMDRGQFDHPAEMEFLNGACLLIKSRVFKEIGFLDEGFYLYGEDFDFCLRARKVGYKLYYQPLARIRHKVTRSTSTSKKFLYRYQSYLRLVRKHTPFYWRPLQYFSLISEFFPLALNFSIRKIRIKVKT